MSCCNICGTIFNSILFFSNYTLTSQIILEHRAKKKLENPTLAVYTENIVGGVKLHVRNQPKVVQRKSMRFVKWQNLIIKKIEILQKIWSLRIFLQTKAMGDKVVTTFWAAFCLFETKKSPSLSIYFMLRNIWNWKKKYLKFVSSKLFFLHIFGSMYFEVPSAIIKIQFWTFFGHCHYYILHDLRFVQLTYIFFCANTTTAAARVSTLASLLGRCNPEKPSFDLTESSIITYTASFSIQLCGLEQPSFCSEVSTIRAQTYAHSGQTTWRKKQFR